jgi:hypothetical protein
MRRSSYTHKRGLVHRFRRFIHARIRRGARPLASALESRKVSKIASCLSLPLIHMRCGQTPQIVDNSRCSPRRPVAVDKADSMLAGRRSRARGHWDPATEEPLTARAGAAAHVRAVGDTERRTSRWWRSGRWSSSTTGSPPAAPMRLATTPRQLGVEVALADEAECLLPRTAAE